MISASFDFFFLEPKANVGITLAPIGPVELSNVPLMHVPSKRPVSRHVELQRSLFYDLALPLSQSTLERCVD